MAERLSKRRLWVLTVVSEASGCRLKLYHGRGEHILQSFNERFFSGRLSRSSAWNRINYDLKLLRSDGLVCRDISESGYNCFDILTTPAGRAALEEHDNG